MALLGRAGRRSVRPASPEAGHGALGELRPGAPESDLEAVLGTPQAPAAKLGSRSQLRSWLYGNVTVLVSEQKVVTIELDFEGAREPVVARGVTAAWRLEEWRAFAADQGWAESELAGVVRLQGPLVSVSLDEDGDLHTARLS